MRGYCERRKMKMILRLFITSWCSRCRCVPAIYHSSSALIFPHATADTNNYGNNYENEGNATDDSTNNDSNSSTETKRSSMKYLCVKARQWWSHFKFWNLHVVLQICYKIKFLNKYKAPYTCNYFLYINENSKVFVDKVYYI